MTDDPPTPPDLAALAALQRRYPGAEISEFGDSRALSDELIALLRSGAKTATCCALRDLEAEGEAMPAVGRHDVVFDWDGRPVLVTETTEVTVSPFDEVPEDFAVAEGEGDFEDWRRGHEAYFARNGGFDPRMTLVCERLSVVEDLDGPARESPGIERHSDAAGPASFAGRATDLFSTGGRDGSDERHIALVLDATIPPVPGLVVTIASARAVVEGVERRTRACLDGSPLPGLAQFTILLRPLAGRLPGYEDQAHAVGGWWMRQVDQA
jgi:uncharacterized protein YhfF